MLFVLLPFACSYENSSKRDGGGCGVNTTPLPYFSHPNSLLSLTLSRDFKIYVYYPLLYRQNITLTCSHSVLYPTISHQDQQQNRMGISIVYDIQRNETKRIRQYSIRTRLKLNKCFIYCKSLIPAPYMYIYIYFLSQQDKKENTPHNTPLS